MSKPRWVWGPGQPGPVAYPRSLHEEQRRADGAAGGFLVFGVWRDGIPGVRLGQKRGRGQGFVSGNAAHVFLIHWGVHWPALSPSPSAVPLGPCKKSPFL